MDRGTILLSCRVDAPVELGAAYDMYSVGLYDYCCWALRDSRLAEDAVHNALLAAAGRGLLPTAPEHARAGTEPTEAEPLRAWIYAAARNECLRLAPFARRAGADGTGSFIAAGTRIGGFPAGGPSAGGLSVGAFGVGHGPAGPQPTRAELWQLVRLRRMLDQLTAAEQEIAELAFRHGFGSAALAAIVGRPLPWIRRAVAAIYARLATECDDGVAATFAMPPFPSPSPSLRRLVLDAATAPDRLKHLAQRQGPYTRFGFPRPIDRRRRIRPVAAAAVGAGAAVLLSSALIVKAADDEPAGALHTSARHERPAAAAPAPAPTTAAPVVKAPAAAPSQVAPRPTPTAAAQAARPAPKPRVATKATPPRRLTASIAFSFDVATRSWNATLTATVRGATASRLAFALWWIDAHGRHELAPTAEAAGDDTYTARVTGLPYGPVACTQATATLADGRTLRSPVNSAVKGSDGSAWCGSARLGEKREKHRRHRRH